MLSVLDRRKPQPYWVPRCTGFGNMSNLATTNFHITEMSSALEQHMYLYSPRCQHRFGKHGEEYIYMAAGWSPHNTFRVFFLLFHGHGVVSIDLRVDLCFFGISLSCFLGSCAVYVLCGCDDPMFVCTTYSSLIDPTILLCLTL